MQNYQKNNCSLKSETSLLILSKGFEILSSARTNDLEKSLAITLIRDAILEKKDIFLTQFLEHEVAELLIEQISQTADMKSLEGNPRFLKNVELDQSYKKTLMLMFVEAVEVEKLIARTGNDYEEIFESLQALNVPFDLVVDESIIFMQNFDSKNPSFLDENNNNNKKQIKCNTSDIKSEKCQLEKQEVKNIKAISKEDITNDNKKENLVKKTTTKNTKTGQNQSQENSSKKIKHEQNFNINQKLPQPKLKNNLLSKSPLSKNPVVNNEFSQDFEQSSNSLINEITEQEMILENIKADPSIFKELEKSAIRSTNLLKETELNNQLISKPVPSFDQKNVNLMKKDEKKLTENFEQKIPKIEEKFFKLKSEIVLHKNINSQLKLSIMDQIKLLKCDLNEMTIPSKNFSKSNSSKLKKIQEIISKVEFRFKTVNNQGEYNAFRNWFSSNALEESSIGEKEIENNDSYKKVDFLLPKGAALKNEEQKIEIENFSKNTHPTFALNEKANRIKSNDKTTKLENISSRRQTEEEKNNDKSSKQKNDSNSSFSKKKNEINDKNKVEKSVINPFVPEFIIPEEFINNKKKTCTFQNEITSQQFCNESSQLKNQPEQIPVQTIDISEIKQKLKIDPNLIRLTNSNPFKQFTDSLEIQSKNMQFSRTLSAFPMMNNRQQNTRIFFQQQSSKPPEIDQMKQEIREIRNKFENKISENQNQMQEFNNNQLQSNREEQLEQISEFKQKSENQILTQKREIEEKFREIELIKNEIELMRNEKKVELESISINNNHQFSELLSKINTLNQTIDKLNLENVR